MSCEWLVNFFIFFFFYSFFFSFLITAHRSFLSSQAFFGESFLLLFLCPRLRLFTGVRFLEYVLIVPLMIPWNVWAFNYIQTAFFPVTSLVSRWHSFLLLIHIFPFTFHSFWWFASFFFLSYFLWQCILGSPSLSLSTYGVFWATLSLSRDMLHVVESISFSTYLWDILSFSYPSCLSLTHHVS